MENGGGLGRSGREMVLNFTQVEFIEKTKWAEDDRWLREMGRERDLNKN